MDAAGRLRTPRFWVRTGILRFSLEGGEVITAQTAAERRASLRRSRQVSWDASRRIAVSLMTRLRNMFVTPAGGADAGDDRGAAGDYLRL